MVVDFTFKIWVSDIHPRSQECPPKSGRVPDFVEFFLHILMFLYDLGGLAVFFGDQL